MNEDNRKRLKKVDWKQVKEDMLKGCSDTTEVNARVLLKHICKETGILFDVIDIFGGTEKGLYNFIVLTNSVRPELGVCSRFIFNMNFSLNYRDPEFTDDDIILSFYPTLSYNLISGDGNGFSIDNWFYYSIKRKEWFLRK